MTIGTKEYYVNEFKHNLMTNFVTDGAQSLISIHSHYAQEINAMDSLDADEKRNYLHNLENAFHTISHEVLGQFEDN